MAHFVLHPELQEQLAHLRSEKGFVAKDWIEKKTRSLNEYMRNAGLKGIVLNLSGGVDSSVTLGLCKVASQQPNSPIQRILGITQPILSTPSHIARAKESAAAFDVEIAVVDQTQIHSDLSSLIDAAVGIKGGQFATGQLRSYQRTPVAYYAAQLMSQEKIPAIVMGTGNYDEDGYLAYFCKAGDGVVDVQLIGDLHKSEVFIVGKELGVPQSVLSAPPSADLWDGQTDEGELGFSYDFVELWTEYLKWSEEKKIHFRHKLGKEALEQFEMTGLKAARIHNANKHKFSLASNL